MKKIVFLLTLMLAWIGVPNASAQLSTESKWYATFASKSTSTMETGKYYLLKNRATDAYVVDDEGLFSTTTTMPSKGNIEDEGGAYDLMFTLTESGRIQSAAGHELPQLSTQNIGGGTVGDGQQLVMRKAGVAGTYAIEEGSSTGYAALKCNELYLNCDLNGVSKKETYTDWEFFEVTLTAMAQVYVTCNYGDEILLQGNIWVPLGEYAGPTFTNYTVTSDPVVVTADTKNLTFEYTQSAYRVTYIYKSVDGTTWKTEVINGLAKGAAYPAVTVAPGVTVEGQPSGTVLGDKTVTLTCNSIYGFDLYKSYDDITNWYSVTLNGSYLYYDASKTYLALDQKTLSNEDAYKWAFVGNPYTGISIYNKAAGKSMQLVSPNPSGATNTGGNIYPVVSATVPTNGFGAFDIIRGKTSTGYYIACHGQTIYMNDRSSKVAYWTDAQDAGSNFEISFVDPNLGASSIATTPATTATITSGKVYRIYNKAYDGRILYDEGSQIGTTTTKTEKELNQYWLVMSSGDGWTLRNLRSGKYIQAPAKSKRIATSSTSTVFYSVKDDANNAYALGTNLSDYNCIHSASGVSYQPVGWIYQSGGANLSASEWVFEEVGDIDGEYTYDELHTIVKGFAGYSESITSGKIYKLYNYSYPERLMTENYMNTATVSGLPVSEAMSEYSQLWYLTKDASGNTTFKNVFTGKYIQDQGSTSAQFTTGKTAKAFVTASTVENEWSAPYFTFSRVAGGQGLHCAASQWYTVVLWTSSANANRWFVKEVDLTEEELAAIAAEYESYQELASTYQDMQVNVSDYQAILDQIFTDKACTQMNATYAAMTDAQLRAATSTLPSLVQDMIVKVKNDSWHNYDGEAVAYEKQFRTASYHVYSQYDWWNGTQGVGTSYCFGKLSNPTGIYANAGDIITIYADQDAPANCVLMLECVSGSTSNMNQSGSTMTLHAGLNTYLATSACYLFVYYEDRIHTVALAERPEIKVHIEGGEVCGVFDVTRGHTDEDWAHMVNGGLMQEFYCHLKNRNLVFNMESSIIKQTVPAGSSMEHVMTDWDNLLDVEYSIMGLDEIRPYWNNILIARSVRTGAYMYATSYGTSYEYYTLSDVMNPNGINWWGPAHENGHIMQTPINMIGMTECSNNLFSNIAVWNLGNATSRAESTENCLNSFNTRKHWVDYGTWQNLRMFWQLYLYFHVCGYNPQFYPNFYKMQRQDPIHKYNARVTWASSDYLKFYVQCCQAAQMDLTEFFESWGFFVIPDFGDYANPNCPTNADDATKRTYYPENNWSYAYGKYVGDYSNYFIYVDQTMINQAKAQVAAMNLPKAGDIMFIDDRVKTQAESGRVPTDAAKCTPGSVDVGDWEDYANPSSAVNYTYTYTMNADGTAKVKMATTGDGAVGYKLYSKDGELLWLSVMNEFTVSAEVAAKLESGEATVVVAQSDLTDLIINDATTANTYQQSVYNGDGSTGVVITTFTKKPTGVQTSYDANGQVIQTTLYSTDYIVPEVGTNNTIVSLSGTSATAAPAELKSASNVIVDGTAAKVALTDLADYSVPSAFTANAVAYARENTQGWNTLCLPFNVEASAFGDDAIVYGFSSVGDEEVLVTELDGTIAAGTPVLVYNETATAWDIDADGNTTVLASAPAGNEFVGSFREKALGEGYYKLNSAGTKFVRTTSASTVAPFRFYLNAGGSATRAYGLSVTDEALTSIENQLTEARTQKATYDLNGRRCYTVKAPGIYIVNGKKTILK